MHAAAVCGADHATRGWFVRNRRSRVLACTHTDSLLITLLPSLAGLFEFAQHHCRLCGHVVCGKCSANKVKLVHAGTAKSHRVCDECFVSFQPAVGGGTGFQPVGGRGAVNGAGARQPQPQQTPAQALLGAPAPQPQSQSQSHSSPAVQPYRQAGAANQGYGSSYGSNDSQESGGADSALSPNAHRMVYMSPLLAENPNAGGCCAGCVIC